MEKKVGFLGKNSVWALACCEWRAAAPELKPLRLPRAPEIRISKSVYSEKEASREGETAYSSKANRDKRR